MEKELLEQLEKWHEDMENERIIDAVLEIPEEQRDYDLIGLLGRAYNNNDEYQKAIDTLTTVKEQGENDALWLFRLAYAYFYLKEHAQALALFEKCKEINPEEQDVDYFINLSQIQLSDVARNKTWENTITPPEKRPEINYLPDMYNDDYYPDFLVDKIKTLLFGVVNFLMSGIHTYEEIQHQLDTCVIAINDLEEEFDENDSEIETVAREDIGMTVQQILDVFEIDIDIETAIQERDW